MASWISVPSKPSLPYSNKLEEMVWRWMGKQRANVSSLFLFCSRPFAHMSPLFQTHTLILYVSLSIQQSMKQQPVVGQWYTNYYPFHSQLQTIITILLDTHQDTLSFYPNHPYVSLIQPFTPFNFECISRKRVNVTMWEIVQIQLKLFLLSL